MAKRKLLRFAEMKTFSNVLQPEFNDIFRKNHPVKGKWADQIFRNSNPIIVELGCGKGEYTVGLARKYPHKNFIGVDIKGARIWRGARTAIEENIKNAAFLRTRIEFAGSFFNKDEVSEIWLTFPDPQPNKSRKRLTYSGFLNLYKEFLTDGGKIHLKTDDEALYHYTFSLIKHNNLPVDFHTEDLYTIETDEEASQIKTFYEKQFLEAGKKIHYLRFGLPANSTLVEQIKDE